MVILHTSLGDITLELDDGATVGERPGNRGFPRADAAGES